MRSRISDGSMIEKPFGLLELGSNSLKFYLVGKTGDSPEERSIRSRKFQWQLAHEFFSTGRLGRGSVEEILECLRSVEDYSEDIPLSSMLAVATGVFRELDNIRELAREIKDRVGVRVRVISGEDEAKLMAKDFHRIAGSDPSLLVDLGGATLEWAWFRGGVAAGWGSLPLGAIRNEYLFRVYKADPGEYLRRSSQYCDAKLGALPFLSPVSVVSTGGTAKAAAACCGSDTVTLDALRELMERVIREGPPAALKKRRQAILLPGLVILWRALLRCQASQLEYGKASVRDGMAGRLVRLLGSYRRDELHATLLLHSSRIR